MTRVERLKQMTRTINEREIEWVLDTPELEEKPDGQE